MNDVAKAADIGIATLYRYFGTKPDFVVAISTWCWEKVVGEFDLRLDSDNATAFEELEFLLDCFIELYKNHRKLLCFNQFFNVYVKNEDISPDMMKHYTALIETLASRFHLTYLKAGKDHTLRTDISERVMFSSSLHLMLAAVTRYAVGLVYDSGTDFLTELVLQKNMILREFRQD